MHKYYVSLCEVEYLEEKKSIQIIVGYFIDDLELTLNKDFNTTLNIDTKKEIEGVDSYFEKYLIDHLEFKINGDSMTYDYVGKAYDLDVVRFYLEITDIKELKSFEIRNTALLRDFSDQKNIIKIKVKNFHKTLYLNNENYKGLLNF
jgi:hypothetical protein